MPDLADVLQSLRVVALPLRQRFRGITVRYAALFEGPLGWTEFSPFPEYGDDEAATWLAGAIDFGWAEPPTTGLTRIGVNATIPAVASEDVSEVLSRYPGCRTVKVKVGEVGQTLADDVARVAAVREIVGPDVRIRIDANGAWSVDDAVRAIDALAPFALEYVEQPCATVTELALVRSRIAGLGTPLAADESIRRAGDPRKVADAGAADIMVVKAQPLGGIHRALDAVRAVGLPAVASSALDTSVGLAMGAYLASALPDHRDAGLGTAALLAADITREPLLPRDGFIDVRRVEPDGELLRQFEPDRNDVEWWRERLIRCHRVLSKRGEDSEGDTRRWA